MKLVRIQHKASGVFAVGLVLAAVLYTVSLKGQAQVTGFQPEMNQGMAQMMQDMHSTGYSGNADMDFLAMMIPHHAGAVDMARLVLQHGTDPATRQLAEEIIAGQTIEIQSMTRRLAMLRNGGNGANMTELFVLGGTRGK